MFGHDYSVQNLDSNQSWPDPLLERKALNSGGGSLNSELSSEIKAQVHPSQGSLGDVTLQRMNK